MISELENLQERINRLEIQGRRVKLFAAGVVVVLLIAFLSGQAAPTKGKASKVGEAEEFILRDADGNIRGLWGLNGASASFGLSDNTGAPRVLLKANDSSGSLELRNYKGAFIAVEVTADAGGARVELYTAENTSSWDAMSDGKVCSTLLSSLTA